jgi:hypothetical protein
MNNATIETARPAGVRHFCRRAAFGASVGVGSLALMGAQTFATEDTAVTGLATDAGTDIKDTAIAVVGALIPFGVSVYLVKKALPWAKSMIH